METLEEKSMTDLRGEEQGLDPQRPHREVRKRSDLLVHLYSSEKVFIIYHYFVVPPRP